MLLISSLLIYMLLNSIGYYNKILALGIHNVITRMILSEFVIFLIIGYYFGDLPIGKTARSVATGSLVGLFAGCIWTSAYLTLADEILNLNNIINVASIFVYSIIVCISIAVFSGGTRANEKGGRKEKGTRPEEE